jgi:hypothetical protein
MATMGLLVAPLFYLNPVPKKRSFTSGDQDNLGDF